MKLSLNAKTLIFSGLSLLLIVGFFFIGYSVGFDKGVDSTRNPKGDGLHFYNNFPESAYSKITYHSTLDCSNITEGVVKDNYGYWVRMGNRPGVFTLRDYDFCPKCMNDYLIEICERKIIEGYNNTVPYLVE